MRGRRLRTSVATLATMVVFASMLATPGQADPTGPTAFYFGANCTGIGEVVLTNAGPSHAAALQVLGTNTVVLVPVSRGIEERGLAAGTSCTFHAFGPDPSDLEENPNPETFPVVIVNG
jgi:hypothetical protein